MQTRFESTAFSNSMARCFRSETERCVSKHRDRTFLERGEKSEQMEGLNMKPISWRRYEARIGALRE